MVSYQDDVTIIVTETMAQMAWTIACREWTKAGMVLNPTKCSRWDAGTEERYQDDDLVMGGVTGPTEIPPKLCARWKWHHQCRKRRRT